MLRRTKVEPSAIGTLQLLELIVEITFWKIIFKAVRGSVNCIKHI